jgi:hypothetical protein
MLLCALVVQVSEQDLRMRRSTPRDGPRSRSIALGPAELKTGVTHLCELGVGYAVYSCIQLCRKLLLLEPSSTSQSSINRFYLYPELLKGVNVLMVEVQRGV